MAISSKYFDGPVTEADHAKYINYIGRRKYGVIGSGDWRVTNSTSGDRTVNISAGSGWGCGVMTTSTTGETLSLAAPSGATDRWHLIAIRRTWSGAGGSAEFVSIQGSSSKIIPAGMSNTPGTVDDQPIALVRVRGGQSSIQEIVDLRVWGDGYIMNEMATTYMTDPGTELRMGRRVFYCTSNGNWVEQKEEDSGWVSGTFSPGWGAHPSDTSVAPAYIRCRRVKVGNTYAIDVRVRVYRRGGMIQGTSTGNITNGIVGHVPEAYRPRYAGVGMTGYHVGFLTMAAISVDGGAVELQALAPNQSVPTGYAFSWSAFYFLDA